MNVDRFEARWKMWSSQPMWSPIVRPWALVIKRINGRAWGHKGYHRGSTIRGDWFNPIPHPLHGPKKMWQFPQKNMVSLRGCLILGEGIICFWYQKDHIFWQPPMKYNWIEKLVTWKYGEDIIELPSWNTFWGLLYMILGILTISMRIWQIWRPNTYNFATRISREFDNNH